MQKSSTFHVYNASAGSGKTYTLVKEYLKVVLQSDDKYTFQKILAITFTNKAAAEMKSRVLKNLDIFSKGEDTDMFFDLKQETGLSNEKIQQRSRLILDAIIQNYSAFSITTIDSFTYKIIKTFAFDLGLNMNFEVELDALTLLNQAVDLLVSKIGVDNGITKILIDFSLEKLNEDKSWDISRELNIFSKILLNENDASHFKKLSTKTLLDFTRLRGKLITHQQAIKEEFKTIGVRGLALIEEAGLEATDFYRSMLPKHFEKLKHNSEKANFFDQSALKQRINEGLFYTKNKSDTIKESIESLLPQLVTLYDESESLFQQFTLNKLTLQNIVPLSVLTKINEELNAIKEEGNIRLIAEFNELISNHIKGQPAPYIYERIGQKFKHYFIDEMQDTSVLQWENLKPLIDNALSQENSSLLLVGDGKQAIYRWRGGEASQFIGLGMNSENAISSDPFPIKKLVKELSVNYRSYHELIQFNNSFFQFASQYLKSNTYRQLFIEGNNQNTTAKKGGYISLDFLDYIEEVEENKLKYAKRVHEIIMNLPPTYLRSEVCILVRSKKHGIELANYLSERNIDIVSAETLLLRNSKKVNFIVDLLKLVIQPKDKETILEVCDFLYSFYNIEEEKHTFFESFCDVENRSFFQQVKKYHVAFDLPRFYQMPFYEKIEEIIRQFKLLQESDAYVQAFLDVVFENQRKGTDIQEFLDFWNLKKDDISLSVSQSKNAVQLMTIHKSKGLEFPVVIFPYNINIYYKKEAGVWISNLPTETFESFEEVLIPLIKETKYINNEVAEIAKTQTEEKELDNFNLLYVAFTRAIEQLYVVTDKKLNKKGEGDLNFTSGLLIQFLQNKGLWSDFESNYSFGSINRIGNQQTLSSTSKTLEQFISSHWQGHNIYMAANSSKLWETEQGKAIEYGNLIHEMMAKVVSKKDVYEVVNQYTTEGNIPAAKQEGIQSILLSIVHHPELTTYFEENKIVYNERELLSSKNTVLIPDRLILNNMDEAVIIDYKTGSPSKNHHEQLINYEKALNLMGFNVEKKLLVYIREEPLVEEI